MRTIIIAAAAALSLTAPVYAGQFDGSVSPSEFAAKHFGADHEPGDGVRFERRTVSNDNTVTLTTMSNDLVERVRSHFAQDHEPGDGARYERRNVGSTTIVSTKNSDLAAFAAAKLKNEGERGNN